MILNRNVDLHIFLLVSLVKKDRKTTFLHSEPENLKKSRQKNLQNCIYGSFNRFIICSKIDFWSFLKLQKMEFGQKKFHDIDLFEFMSFLAWTFLNFLAHCDV